MKNTPCPRALAAARTEVEAALAAVRRAKKALGDGGWADTEAHLAQDSAFLTIWTTPGGMFDSVGSDK